MLRLALAAVVFCSTLLAAFAQTPSGVSVSLSAGAAPAAEALRDCAPSDDDREWRAGEEQTASITESAWKWRTLPARVAAAGGRSAIIVHTSTQPPPTRATDAPSYLHHIPLLI